MIAQIKTPRQKQRFLNACRGKLCLGATMPLAFALFGKSQPGRFFAGPTLALDVGGSTAWLAGHANPEELAGFLAFCGCEAVVLDEAECPPPTGWKRAKTHSVFGLAPGRQLPLPEADAALWQSLAKNTEPAAGKAADLLFPDRPSKRDDFYSELCSKRSRGLARVWTLEREGNIICTVGAYALANGQAYMACGETVEALRGKGVGGRLIVEMANALAAGEALRAAIEVCPFHFKGERVTITLSAGVSAFAAGERAEQVFERADQALYRAKRSGRNRIEVG